MRNKAVDSTRHYFIVLNTLQFVANSYFWVYHNVTIRLSKCLYYLHTYFHFGDTIWQLIIAGVFVLMLD